MNRTAALASVIILATLTLAAPATPAQSSTEVTPPAPAPVSMPSCQEEDGYGVALCEWDGIISGDCAPSYLAEIGGLSSEQAVITSADCVRLHAKPAQVTLDTVTPAGATLVHECLEQYTGTELVICFS